MRFSMISFLPISSLAFIVLGCSQEAQVGTTAESRLMSEYSASTSEFDNVNPTVGDDTITASITGDTNLGLSWIKAEDDSLGSPASALSYRVYMSKSGNISNADETLANGTALTDWALDQGEVSINIPQLKSLNNLYVNIVVQDEKGNATAYRMTSVINSSPFGDLYVKGKKGADTLNEALTSYSSGGSTFYDAYLVSTADTQYSFKIANEDDSASWLFDDVTVDSGSLPLPTRASDGMFEFSANGGTTGAPVVHLVSFDATDKSAPKLQVKVNKALLEIEFELQLKLSKVLDYASPSAAVVALRSALRGVTSGVTFTDGSYYEYSYELHQDDISKCTLKNAGYALRQKFKVAENTTTLPTAFPTYTNSNVSTAGDTNSFLNPVANGSKSYSVSLKGRHSDRQSAYENNSVIAAGLTADKTEEFARIVGTNSVMYERTNSFKSFSNSGCSSASACSFATIGDLLVKFPNTDLSGSSSDTLANIAGSKTIYDAEYGIFAKDAVIEGLHKTKKATLNIVYEVSGGTATPIMAKMSLKLASGTAVEGPDTYKSALSKMQSMVNAWAGLTDWVEPSDTQIDKTSFLYKNYNRCQ